jgi:hypothetical protein
MLSLLKNPTICVINLRFCDDLTDDDKRGELLERDEKFTLIFVGES